MHLIDVLRGKAAERISQWDHDRLSVFGIGADLDERRGAASSASSSRSASRASTTRATARCGSPRPRRRCSRRAAGRDAPRRRATRKAPAVRGKDLGPVSSKDLQLLEKLKAWRREEARTQGVPAYVILHDSALLEIARKRPDDLIQMNGISGIGVKRLERYGSALLRLLRTE